MSEQPIATHLTRNLDPKAIDEVWDELEAKRARARRSKRRWGLAAAFVTMAVLLFGLGRFTKVRDAAQIADRPEAVRLQSGASLPRAVVGEVDLDDGSHVSVASGATLVSAMNSGSAVAFTQLAGTVVFDVKPHGPRQWTIDAGLARVWVLGTRFRVSRVPHHVRVDVERGIVRVTSEHLEGGQRDLSAGQFVEVIDEVEAAAPSTSNDEGPSKSRPTASVVPTPLPVAPTPPPSGSLASALPPPSEWRPLFEKGSYQAAYDALGHANVGAETNQASTVEDLVRIADVARLSGHPLDAVAPLECVVTAHSADPRAATAAFTLGKIRLAAAPALAAADFENAIALGLPVALREDAFARRVEAHAAAGETARAKLARTAYEQSYPEGHHREAVVRWAP